MEIIRKLEAIRDYGQAQDWSALVLDGEELIPTGRAAWLEFVWLSRKTDQQCRVYEWLRDLSHS